MIEVATRFAAVPAQLRELDQWVVWCYEQRGDKTTKVPYNPQDGSKASSTNTETWNTFALCCRALDEHPTAYNGIGFMFKKGGGIFGFDGDHLYDPATGTIAPEAKAWLDRFATYTELSPSGHGIHAIGFGVLPGKGKKREPFEVYDQERYFTITGNHVPGYPTTLAHVNGALTDLWEHLAKGTTEAQVNPVLPHEGASVLTDSEVLDLADCAKNGAKFRDLWSGGMAGHASASNADLALCTMLAFWCRKDADQMDRLFRQSGLMRDKWDERRGGSFYRELTIDKAISLTEEVYEKPEPSPVFISAKKARNEYDQKVDEETEEVLEDEEGAEPTRPTRSTILLSNKWIRTQVKQCVAALIEGNKATPVVFVQGRSLVRVVSTRNGLVPEPYTVHSLRTRLSACADLFRFDVRSKKQAKADGSDTLIQAILAEPSWDIPELDGIIEVPILRQDGTILDTPGYDPQSRLMYMPPASLHMPTVSDAPAPEDITKACTLFFDDLLSDFSFAGPADKAHALALFLLPYLRDSIDGATPLHLIEAPTPGSGKGLLADILLSAAVGHRIGVVTDARDPDEQRKRITAQFHAGMPVILLDNIADTLDSDALASALTARVWSDRKLGSSEMAHYPVRCIWVATANNPTMSTEIARRCIRIRIDPKQDRPWNRTGFKHSDLRAWVEDHRGELVWCALTLLRAWVCAGRPPGTDRLGSYEQWATAIGGVFSTAGVPGFLTNLSEIYDLSDPQGSAWRQFIDLWWDKYQQQEVGVKDLFTLAQHVDSLTFGKSATERGQRTSFGMQLGRYRERVIDAYLVHYCGEEHKTALWQLLSTTKSKTQDDAEVF